MKLKGIMSAENRYFLLIVVDNLPKNVYLLQRLPVVDMRKVFKSDKPGCAVAGLAHAPLMLIGITGMQ